MLVLESGLLTSVGTALGIGFIYALVLVLQPYVEQQFGLHIPFKPLSVTELAYLAAVLIAGVLVGLLPAWKAYRNALNDGLAVRL